MIFRFRFKYKYICAVILLIVLVLFILILKSISLKRCTYEDEPIDVVYTWVNGSDPLFLKEILNYTKFLSSRYVDKSKPRYFDRHELKFSLRSLEKYAPWIRHVYIVTNGQIPYWLNLDYGKVTIISHEDIFANPYDLPTFSSPAIESHLHRIPGISKKFLYFNDDIYLGAPVYLDDFYSYGHGYQVYLDYPMPSCVEKCPWIYVHDGQCDKECNVFECQMDGGDCDLNITTVVETEHNESLLNVSYLYLQKRSLIEGINISSQNMSSATTKNGTYFEGMVAKLQPSLESSSIKRLVNDYNRQKMVSEKLRPKEKNARRTKNKGKRFFDAYRESLQHTNRLYNIKYGFNLRYVPAHMPFLIDVDVMTRLVSTFPKEFATTSSNRFRSKNDIQFAFGYFNFLMEEMVKVDIEDIFSNFDTDLSGTWSDREIRTVLTRIYAKPLSTVNIDDFDRLLINCSKSVESMDVTTPEYERYIDSILPTISKNLVTHCEELKALLVRKFGKKSKYTYESIKDVNKYVTFEMIQSNIQSTVIKFDKIRQKPTKFVCLNDNIYSSRNESTINAIWYDFYVSLLPTPSKFELPSEYRNRFLYIKDLRWYQTKMTIYLYGCATVFIYFITCLLCKNKLLSFLRNKLFC